MHEHRDRGLIGVLPIEPDGQRSDLRRHDPGIVWAINGSRTDTVADVVDSRDALGKDQSIGDLLLGADNDRVGPAEGRSCLAERVGCLEGILALVATPIRRKYLHHFIHSSAHFH